MRRLAVIGFVVLTVLSSLWLPATTRAASPNAEAYAAAGAALAIERPPAEFIANALRYGVPVKRAGFVGLEWDCSDDPQDDETCYAGKVTRTTRYVTLTYFQTGP